MKELKAQIGGALLVILTVTLVVCAVLSYQRQDLFRLPDDGVTWTDHLDPSSPDKSISVIAMYVQPGGPADQAGIRLGDELIRIGGRMSKPGVLIRQATDVPRVLKPVGAWGAAEYVLNRNGVEITAKVIVSDATADQALLYQYAVGAAYLLIGLFLFIRRNRAPHSLHFFLLCLSSFVLHTFHFTAKLDGFDTFIYLGNVTAGMLAPALFLHFCLTFPEPRPGWTRWKAISVYLPATSLIALQLGVTSELVRTALPDVMLRWLVDRVWLLVYCGSYCLGAVLLHLSYRRADDPTIRQQIKWLRNGTLVGICPFIAFYAAPFVAGIVPTPEMRLAVLFLVLIPVTWAYAILRYRLMDVDIIFQQGYVYLLSTLAVLGVVSMLVYALAQRDGLGPTSVILLVLVAAFIFEPLRGWIQQQFDKYVFYKDRWDYRQTLIGFARELSTEMDLDRALASVGQRLIDTLSVRQVAFFLASESRPDEYEMHSLYTSKGPGKLPKEPLDLRFLEVEPSSPYLFFESTRSTFDVVTRDMPSSVRATIARLDLTYYIPCTYRGRTLAWFALSRTEDGDFLSSVDIDLLSTLSGYVGVAVENAGLYRSLADKMQQYERLKEFSENIVESINVGVLAAGLNDRVESWNSQMERLTGIPRRDALGRPLSELFPAELASHFEALQGSLDVHQLYRIVLRPAEVVPIGSNGYGVRSADGNGNGNGALAEIALDEAATSQPEEIRRDVTVNVAIAPLVARDGSCIGRLVILDDITEREELERKLVQADKLSSIGLLAAGVAHEVNTPLAVISTYAQMLAKQVAGDEQKSKLLDKIARQTFRASEIVNSLLNFSRTSSTAFEDIDLNRVVRETLTLLEHQLQKASVQLECDLEEVLPLIRGNAGKLQQVFLNLFINARDAMESGGTLRVTTKPDSMGVQVEVSDSGPGIPRENLARIFDPFFTTKGARKGTGLGLSVSYGIVEEHGGVIEVESKPGEGTVFRLQFPAAKKAVNA